MEIGKKICVKRDKVYGEGKFRYQEGTIVGEYTHHTLVKFKYENGNSFRESFFKYEILSKGDIKDESIF